MSRISVHVKFSLAPCLPQILTMGSYPSRSGMLSPLRVLKYPAVSSAVAKAQLYHQCTPAHLIAIVGQSRTPPQTPTARTGASYRRAPRARRCTRIKELPVLAVPAPVLRSKEPVS